MKRLLSSRQSNFLNSNLTELVDISGDNDDHDDIDYNCVDSKDKVHHILEIFGTNDY